MHSECLTTHIGVLCEKEGMMRLNFESICIGYVVLDYALCLPFDDDAAAIVVVVALFIYW